MTEALAVGVDLGGTNLKIALVDRNAQFFRQSIKAATFEGL